MDRTGNLRNSTSCLAERVGARHSPPMPTDLSSPTRLAHSLRHGSSGLLVVVFSQVRVPVGKFGLERLFAKTRHNCLFLNDTQNGWYLGLDQEIDLRVSQAISDMRPERILYYGSSMGGYGALATGLRRQDGDIHAFGPELRPGRPGYQSTAYGISAGDSRLCSFDEKSQPHNIDIQLYFGGFDPVDAANAAFARDCWPKANLHLLKSSHSNHDHLYSQNIIRRIIRTFERDPAQELASKQLLLPESELVSLSRFGALAEAFAAGRDPAPEDIASLPGYGSNPGMLHLCAEIHAARGNLSEALIQMKTAEDLIEENPVLSSLPKRWRKELPLQRVKWLIQGGQTNEARDLMLSICRTFPVDTAMKHLCESLAIEAAI